MRNGGLIRLHQLTGPNQKKVAFSYAGTIQYKMDDIPIKAVIQGKKYVSSVMGIIVTFDGKFTKATAGNTIVNRQEFMNELLNQIQVDGTAMGTIVAANSMKSNLIDLSDYICNNGRPFSPQIQSFTVQGSTDTLVSAKFYVPFSYLATPAWGSMAPMTSLVRDGNIKIDLAGASGIANVTISGNITASAVVLWKDEITIAPGFQVTRFKSTAAAGASSDTVTLNSFGRNSTLTGVNPRAAICGLFESTRRLLGDGRGAFYADTVTDFSALQFGIEQTNDIAPFFDQLLDAYPDNMLIGYPDAGALKASLYPMFTADVNGLSDYSQASIATRANFFPIFPWKKGGQIAKFPIADGNPSYTISANNTGSDHYAVLFALYQWEDAQLNALIARIQNDGIGTFLYGTDGAALIPVLKTAKEKAKPSNFSKYEFLPRKLLPPNFVEE